MLNRNVYAIPAAAEPGRAAAPPGPPEQPKPVEKLVKYFPSEALALYTFLDPTCRTIWSGAALAVPLWISLLLSIVFLIMFLRKFWTVTWGQTAISTAAFVLYIAAVGGPFLFVAGWHPGFGILAAGVATAFLIFVKAPEPPAPVVRV